ncbi:MAG: peptide ABC transporter substrate-binding protein [Candidatus Colwellbacteria bacterium]|nr:peptide ABC transporter substrate-binding protein [Candidatus Colwellbacteria bacterium]
MNDKNQLDDFFGLKNEDEDKRPSIREIITKKIQKKLRIRLVPKVLSKKERYVVLALILTIVGSIIAIPFATYFHFTKEAPDYGGKFIEGMVGKPRYINPLLSQSNDTDRDLVTLVYSGLLKYTSEGKIVPDLAQSYEISSDGLNYTIYLKEGTYWHDGKRITADDIIFTIHTAQNSDYGSPQRINWQGVEIEKINDSTVMFKLQNRYAQFLNNLTVKILPKHIWEDVKPINFALSEFNLKPVGSGPYRFDRLKKDREGEIQSYRLSANKSFYNERPFINEVEIKFYNSEEEMIAAYNRSEIDSLSFISSDNLETVKFKQRLDLRELKLPRYFAVFFNQNKSAVLSDKNVRLALSHGTDKEALIKNVLGGRGIAVYSPMMGGVLDIPNNVKKYEHDPELAKKILETSGWIKGSDGVLAKKDQKLNIKITTSTWPELTKVAKILKEQWDTLGIDITIEVLPTLELQQTIKDRNYETLLFGAVLNIDPDPFSLWHSSQKRDPGLNLALYDNKSADTLLEDARQTLNPLERAKKYDDFQKLIIEDIPALFLYNPLYVHGQAKKIKGADGKLISLPSDRFINIDKWYINTKRIWR